MAVTPARKAAFKVLLRVFRDCAYSSSLLENAENELSEADAALCHNITYGVLRNKFRLDAFLSRFSTKSLQKIDLEVLIALEIGLFQLAYLDRIPAYSAINQSVELVKFARKRSAAGFANAVLRKAEKSISEYVEVHSVLTQPKWLVDLWVEEFGEDVATKIVTSNDEQPASFARQTLKGVLTGFTLSIDDEISVPEFHNVKVYRYERKKLEVRKAFEQGLIYFQDLASQIVASLAIVPAEGSFLDVCAAPGGKISFVAAENSNSGISFYAGDLHGKRCETLRKNLERQGVSASVVEYDALAALPFDDGAFDVVLVDAPCSGTGTLRNNPEIRYSIKPQDLSELPSKQLKILTNASNVVKPGGRLIYSTCSLQRAENEQVVFEFLERKSEFVFSPSNSFSRFRTKEGFLRTFPFRDKIDGFFAAEFIRNA
ncbi:MAG: 16S rRNA (cytosine(967)-C(5))-methyltransferase RsmB [Pyrinomonadaceae bacterium]